MSFGPGTEIYIMLFWLPSLSDLLPIGSYRYYQSQYPLGYLISLQVNCPFACIYIVVVVVVVVDHCMVVCLKHH